MLIIKASKIVSYQFSISNKSLFLLSLESNKLLSCLIKLSNKQSVYTLNNLYEFLESYSAQKLTIIDARINNQIILNE